MYLSYSAIEEAAETFIKTHHSDRSIPIPVEKIVEIDLRISIVPIPGLLRKEGVDAFLSHDFKELYIDQDHYMNQTNRSHFTLAHEIGHYVLHQDVVSKITTLDEWKKFILGEETGRSFYEAQAHDFAGCLLMPREELLTEYAVQENLAKEMFKKMKFPDPGPKTLYSFIANPISKKFEVSPKSAEIRLSKVMR